MYRYNAPDELSYSTSSLNPNSSNNHHRLPNLVPATRIGGKSPWLAPTSRSEARQLHRRCCPRHSRSTPRPHCYPRSRRRPKHPQKTAEEQRHQALMAMALPSSSQSYPPASKHSVARLPAAPARASRCPDVGPQARRQPQRPERRDGATNALMVPNPASLAARPPPFSCTMPAWATPKVRL